MVDSLVDPLPECYRWDFSHLAAGAALSGTRRRQRGGRRGHGRLGEYWQRAGARILGLVVGLPYASGDLYIVVFDSGRTVLGTPGSRLRRRAYLGGICDSELFWWRIRHDARVGDRLLRSTQRRPHLRLDAFGLGSGEPVWSHVARRNAGSHRVVPGCVANYRCIDGHIGCAPVHPPLAADAAANSESAMADEAWCCNE